MYYSLVFKDCFYMSFIFSLNYLILINELFLVLILERLFGVFRSLFDNKESLSTHFKLLSISLSNFFYGLLIVNK